MSWDADRYPDPEAFIPEWFLDMHGQLIEHSPVEFMFGGE